MSDWWYRTLISLFRCSLHQSDIASMASISTIADVIAQLVYACNQLGCAPKFNGKTVVSKWCAKTGAGSADFLSMRLTPVLSNPAYKTHRD